MMFVFRILLSASSFGILFISQTFANAFQTITLFIRLIGWFFGFRREKEGTDQVNTQDYSNKEKYFQKVFVILVHVIYIGLFRVMINIFWNYVPEQFV